MKIKFKPPPPSVGTATPALPSPAPVCRPAPAVRRRVSVWQPTVAPLKRKKECPTCWGTGWIDLDAPSSNGPPFLGKTLVVTSPVPPSIVSPPTEFPGKSLESKQSDKDTVPCPTCNGRGWVD